MIPPFTDDGVLPAGIHPATVDEIGDRFGRGSELRRVQMESVRWMISLADPAVAERIILNGSFVTDLIEPNDVDCLILVPSGVDLPPDSPLLEGLPFLDIQFVRLAEFEYFADWFFARQRNGRSKGVVEVIR